MRGFSLVELSIVLVILGLLTGGILTGQNLIRAAELRSVTTDVNKYQAAVHSFRDKYFAIPGDFRNATKFWGILAGTGADSTCRTTIATGAPTCDGNGDGTITDGNGGGATNHNESFRAWQHLANAGLVEGSYTGISYSGAETNQGKTPGVNVPKSKLGNSGYHLGFRDTPGTPANEFVITAHTLYLAQFSTSVSTYPILLGSEAWNIDTKMDDGKPGLGRMRSPHNGTGAPDCVDADDPNTAQYNLTSTTLACRARFLILN